MQNQLDGTNHLLPHQFALSAFPNGDNLQLLRRMLDESESSQTAVGVFIIIERARCTMAGKYEAWIKNK
jgi:hypothetical protein